MATNMVGRPEDGKLAPGVVGVEEGLVVAVEGVGRKEIMAGIVGCAMGRVITNVVNVMGEEKTTFTNKQMY